MATKEQRAEYYQRNKHYWADYSKRRIAANRAMMTAYKLASGCVDCGYNEHAEALDFDHVKGSKVGNLSKMANKSLEAVQAEISKCEVVCANCHRVRTRARRTKHERL